MSVALVQWTSVDREGDEARVPVPQGQLLVRSPAGDGWNYYVAEWKGGVWRLVGAPERAVYHVSHWAEIEDAVVG